MDPLTKDELADIEHIYYHDQAEDEGADEDVAIQRRETAAKLNAITKDELPIAWVMVVRHPDYANDYFTSTAGRVEIISIDLGSLDPEEYDEEWATDLREEVANAPQHFKDAVEETIDNNIWKD